MSATQSPPVDVPSAKPRPPHRTTPLFVTSAVFLLLAFLASSSGLLLVVADHVVPGWVLGAGLVFTSLVLVLVRSVRRRSMTGQVTTRRRVLARSMLILLAVAAVLSSGGGAAGDLGAGYRVLEPAGPDGCRAVVREASFLFSGSGDVYAVGTSGIGWRASSWTADDGYRPIAAGTYDLHWSQGEGVLVVRGRETDPVWPALHEITCG